MAGPGKSGGVIGAHLLILQGLTAASIAEKKSRLGVHRGQFMRADEGKRGFLSRSASRLRRSETVLPLATAHGCKMRSRGTRKSSGRLGRPRGGQDCRTCLALSF